jgi:cysteine-rich repeat protein
MKNMKKTVQKMTLMSLLCVFSLAGMFMSLDKDAHGYYQRSNAISKNFNFDRWNGPKDIRNISDGTVTIKHKMEMTQGAYQMCENEPLQFAYSDEFFFNASNGFWDTPNAAWCSHINDLCRSIYKGQKIYDASGVNWWMSKWPQPGYTRDQWWEKGLRENRINEGWIMWTGVKHTAPGQPYAYVVSSNPRVVSCNGMSCRAVGDGSATLTAYAKRAEARIWGLVEFQKPRNTWKWTSEDDPYLNGARVNRMWMSAGHTRIGSWTIAVGDAARCDYCGDGAITAPEQCDTTWSGNTYPIDDCTAGYNQSCQYCISPSATGEVCTIQQKPGPFCGDGTVQVSEGEQCDNGSQNGVACNAVYDGTCQYCDNSCQFQTVTGPYCGDGVPNGTEQCDDGNTDETDGCFNNCTRPCECGEDTDTFQDGQPNDTCAFGDTQWISNTTTQWQWNCVSNSSCSQSAGPCSARCYEVDLDVPVNVYLQEDGSEVEARVKISGIDNMSNVDCSIEGQSVTFFPPGSDTSTPATITITGPRDISATCTMNVYCGTGSGGDSDSITVTKSVNTLCAERSCNAQGTCQSTPRSGVTSVNDCTSTCTSDADCSSGRMIETRP